MAGIIDGVLWDVDRDSGCGGYQLSFAHITFKLLFLM